MHNNTNSIKIHVLLLALAWIVMQAIIWKQFGIVTSFEAAKYLEQAKNFIATGSYSTNNFLFYSTEILLIALCIKLNIGFGFLVFVQMMMNAFSLFAFYKLVDGFTNRKRIALGATLFFLCMFYYHLYNVHLFTESLFFSFSILFAYFLFSIKKLSLSTIAGIVLFLGLLLFTRPTGLLFIPGTLFFLIFRFGKKRAWPLFLFSIIGGGVAFYFLLNAALDSGGEFDFLLPYIEEHVICGVPTFKPPHHIPMPVNKNSVEGLWHIFLNNQSLFLSLIKKRFFAFWGVTRSFYSPAHNMFIAAYFYSLYVLALPGLIRLMKYYLAEAIFMLTYILLVMLTVLLSCDEWHNRFIFSILPFLLLLATGLFSKKTN